MDFAGRDGNSVLFSSETMAVVVDEQSNTVTKIGHLSDLSASAEWQKDGEKPSDVSFELATAALTDLDIKVFSENDRMYTIPKSVQAEARRGLEWRKQNGRGGTSVGLNTARTLAEGGQIGIKKIRHIAKYFPRHAVDKKGTGYKPSEEGYPSNGRIAWALWGGDAGERWASAIVDRVNAAEASNLDFFAAPKYVDFSSFAESDSVENDNEFYIRLFADGSGFDRMYMRDKDGVLSVWDDGDWTDLGISANEFSVIDSQLDTEELFNYFHAPVDAEAALVASAYLDSGRNTVLVSELNETEAALAAQAIGDLDIEDLDAVLAAGSSQYTEEERSKNASRQARDATGRFAKQGSRVRYGQNTSDVGIIKGFDNRGNATVQKDDGSSVSVPVKSTSPIGTVPASPTSGQAAPADAGAPPKQFTGGPLDLSGILGEPRDVSGSDVRIPGTLPPLTAQDLNMLLTDWPNWVAAQRASFTPADIPQVDINPDDRFKAENAYNNPYLRKWLDKRAKASDGTYYYPNRIWYDLNPDYHDITEKKSYKDVYGTPKKRKKKKSAVVAAATAKPLTPATSDIPPVFMAVVAPDDPQAVMDLICLIPANTASTAPAIFTYKKGKWEKDEGMLRDLKSPTPPPVVVLDDKNLKSVMGQMNIGSSEDTTEKAPVTASIDYYLSQFYRDGEMLPLTAAGGLDRNRGNAERLRRYWTVGPGGLKIRWGTGGDWTRCVRQLSKYLGPRARGYCALRHKEMTGLWTGDKAHRQMYGRRGKGVFVMSDEMLLSSEQVLERAEFTAQMNEVRSRVVTASGGFQAPAESVGAKFEIPLVVPEGVETGDGRKFSKGAITMRDMPLPLMWQIKTNEGHYGSVVVGRIDHMERVDGGIGNARGVFDTGEYGREAERLVRGGFIRGISADLDKFEADEDPEFADDDKSDSKKSQNKLLISKARVMGVTLVPKPAFQECTINLVKEPEYMDSTEKDALVACASVVASIPIIPPRDWFKDPKLAGPTPLTVTDDGRVFGHIAAWHVDHIGLAFGTKPPRSKSGYSYFHTGVLRCDDGSDVPVGQLTLAGGHASLSADARAAAKHYDDTGSAFADVSAGEDAYGIWVAGSLRPEVTPQQVRAIRASAPSGDWRPIGGNLELVAVCQVNVPGFPLARARVASGQMYALVAAGASYLARLKDDPEYLAAVAEDTRARFAAIRSEIGQSPITAGVGMNTKNSHCVEVLDRLLADVVGFSFRAHGYHWNVVGEDFHQYHELFGQIYDDVNGSIDPLAENVRKLGGFPTFSLVDFAEKSSLGMTTIEGGSAKAMAADLLLANEALVEELKAAFVAADNANEQAIANFIADRLDKHQKWSWQLASSVMPDDLIIVEGDDREATFETVFASLAEQGLVASSDAYGDFAYIPEKVREKAAEKGQALPDGSFPIRNIKDLKNAVHAYGRAKPSKKGKVRAHIMKRARALGREDLIPETFKSASIEAEELAAIKLELSARVHGLTAAGEAGVDANPKALTEPLEETPEAQAMPKPEDEDTLRYSGQKYTARTQPRDAQGRFRQVLARLKMDLGDASLDSVARKVEQVENLDNTGNYAAAAAGAHEVINIVDRIDTKALNPKALESVRMGATALAEAIANLPLPFKNQSQKIRYSDVPPALRNLMDDMMAKVEAKIGKEDAKIATEGLRAFKSGSDVLSQGEISSQMNKLLRLLT